MTQTRYKIADIPLDGEIHSVGAPVRYADGSSYLRNIVVCSDSALGRAYIPVTVFGALAVRLDPEADIGRGISGTMRLTSRQYTTRDGDLRWGLSLAAYNVALEPEHGGDGKYDNGGNGGDARSDEDDEDGGGGEDDETWTPGGADIPF